MKKYLLLLFAAAFVYSAPAQISIQPVLPLSGIMQKSNLWNIAIINTSAGSYDCRLELVLRNRATGLEVLTAMTGQFQTGPGAKQLTAAMLMPVQYNYLSAGGFGGVDDFIPVGDYTACYRLTANTKNIIAEECTSFDVEPLSPPMLINPADSSVLIVQPPQFSWIPPAPANLFRRLQYEVLITEILPGQKPEEAMQQNLPFYTEPNIAVNNLSYPATVSSFEKDKWYAWQVVARDDNNYAGKSEVWVFKIHEAYNTVIETETPFTRIKTNNPELAIAPNGVLKIAYANELKDSAVKIFIRDLSSEKTESKPVYFNAVLVPGENFIRYDLKKIMKPKDGKIYAAELTNSRGEKLYLRFAIKYFKK